jgi:hypothetical protein
MNVLPDEVICVIFKYLNDFRSLRLTSYRFACIGKERFEDFKTAYFAKCINHSNRDLATSIRYKQYVIGYRLDSLEQLDIFDWADMFDSVTSHYSFDALFLIYNFDISQYEPNMAKYISEIIHKLKTPTNTNFFSKHYNTF